MKAITFLKVILITAITFVTFGANAETTLEKIKRTGKVTVGTEAAFPPFEFVENGKIVGYGKDILDYIIADLVVELVQLDLPWQGILPGVLAGKFDFVATTVSVRPKRAKTYAFTVPIAEGTSWLMEVDGNNGGRLNESVFDFNKDRAFNDHDMINVGDTDSDGEDNYIHGSGIQRKNAGILSRPGIINHPDGRTESKYVTTSKGKVESILEDSGRNRHTPWREIR